jgi:predicted RNA-binding Zn-ribbon protein involved in translation (DUF1610 family)
MEEEVIVSPNCPKCGRAMQQDRFDNWSCFNVNCKEEAKERRKKLNKRVSLHVKGTKRGSISITSLLQHNEKVSVPINFQSAEVKVRKLGGYQVVCPSCGKKSTLTEDDIRRAGVGLGKPVGPPMYEIVAHGLLFVRDWNAAMEAAEKGDVDYIEWRVKVAQVENKRNDWPFEITTTGTADLKLKCGDSIPVSFGEHITFKKEPDRVEAFLRLGLKGERTTRWLRYVYGGEDAPANLGEHKAKELTDFISQTQAEKERVEKLSEKLTAEIREKPSVYGAFDRLTSQIEVLKDNDVKMLTAAQKEKLDFVDKVLLRIANTPFK